MMICVAFDIFKGAKQQTMLRSTGLTGFLALLEWHVR